MAISDVNGGLYNPNGIDIEDVTAYLLQRSSGRVCEGLSDQ